MLSYLASPFNHPDKDQAIMEARFEAACRMAGRLLAAGIKVFSPIAHNVPILKAAGIQTGWEVWAEFDKEMLSRCDRLIVLMLDGWRESGGVQSEIKFARERGVPIEYITEETWERLLEMTSQP